MARAVAKMIAMAIAMPCHVPSSGAAGHICFCCQWRQQAPETLAEARRAGHDGTHDAIAMWASAMPGRCAWIIMKSDGCQ